ncbi:DUF6923 family protein [Profundibacterium mesophilum]|uniref:DUF11 domain-containing protein n=1 Tax=Profundibacterium mesophilum KAUST100406-0324 TaxID=1037889 RepID=A0A921NWS6_9RHOB|nr:GEVED domain-containing protein [Profundibacterium mesophilum]KAF0676870.1 hypothetical protein PMES_00666 [Profundibacterium mesophilum KAUST100406-0324]
MTPIRHRTICFRRVFAALLAWLAFAAVVLAHGAWLGGGGISLTPASKATIRANLDAGAPPISNGDIIEVIADFPVITDGTLDGPGGYATIYVPGGTEVVGASITDATGNAVPAKPARASTGSGVSKGWGPKGQQIFDISVNGWNPSDTSQCELAGFSTADCNAGLAYTYGDTGIFYSTRSDTQLFANGSPIATLENGYLVNPTNGKPWPSVGGTGTPRVHNKWDAVQINAFGSGGTIDPNGFTIAEETSITGGRGTTPFRAGSPVAGPESGADWDRYGVTGPWNRIRYDGSCRADDPAIAGPDGPATGAGSVFPETLDPGVNTVEVCTPTTDGFDLNTTDATALPAETNAVRYAFGGIAENEVYYAALRLRITDVGQIGYINAEGHGGDSAEGAAAGNDNPWRYWVAGTSAVSPAGPDDLYTSIEISAVNGSPYTGGDIPQGATLTYRVSYVNVSLSPMTNVVSSVDLPAQTTSTANFRVVSGADIRPAGQPAGGTFTFAPIPTLDGLGSGAIEFDVFTSAVSGETVTANTDIVSDEGGIDSDTVTTNVTPAPVDTMPICNGSRVSIIDWASDAPALMNSTTNVSRFGVDATVTLTDASAPLRASGVGTANELYATSYGGNPILTQRYSTTDISFSVPMNAVQFYVTSLDLDESVTVYGERGGQRIQPAIADGPLSAPMLRQANADGSVLGERNNSFSTAALPENFAVLIGFGVPVDRIVFSHGPRQNNGANFASSMQVTDIQACADFTDAPSALIDTFHSVDANFAFYLGGGVSGDAGPGNSNDANSDDDDDGVNIPPLVQGFIATVETAVTGAQGNLTGWIDYNGNGVFEENTAEEVATDLVDDGLGVDEVAGDGLIQFEVIVPGDAVLSQTFARFRWSSAPGLRVGDVAPDGEVEDYPINIGAAPLVDRGDAPASYGDPLHIIADTGVAGTYLGDIPPDPEAASQATADASGDDLDGNDDEDGAVIPQLYLGGTQQITVKVNEVTSVGGTMIGAVAYLQGWIDFDGNGQFDPADRIATDLQDGSANDKDGTLNGEIVFDVAVPGTATQLPTFARFRWSTSEGVVPVALDGEVEDYSVTISGDDPPVTCDNGLYQIATKKSTLKKLRFTDNGGSYTLNLQDIGASTQNLNAGWGYNELDGYIYGVRSGKAELWRIDGSGNFTQMPNLPNTAADGSNAGDILPNGVMVYKIDNSTWQLLDLADPNNPVDAGVLNLSQNVSALDFAANPVDGFIYGINASTDRVYRVSGNNGLPGTVLVTEFGPAIYNGSYGATFFDENGRFYAYDNNSNDIYLINTVTGNRQLLATSVDEEGGTNDGASCRGASPIPLSGFGGNVYIDENGSDIRDGGESNLGGGIRIDLYSDNGTPNDLSDDGFIGTTDTAADGTYSFIGLPTAATYRVEVDINDADLPPGSQIGTSNPLVNVTTDSTLSTTPRNFGFDPQFSDLSITKEAFRAGTSLPVTTASVGDLIDWRLSVTNNGPGSPSGVTVIEKIPNGYEYVSDTAPPTGDYYNSQNGVWFVDEILSGVTETISIRVRVTQGSDRTNVAEIIASSLPDLDSDPDTGIFTDDLNDGLADDDEASVTIGLGVASRLLSGQLFIDNGAGGATAHDGTRTGQEGAASDSTLQILDDAGLLLASPKIGADGRWTYALAETYSGSITLSAVPSQTQTTISETSAPLPGTSNPDPHDGSFSFVPASGTSYGQLDIGLIRLPTLTQDQSSSIEPGQVVLLPHLYSATTAGTLDFSYTQVAQAPAGAFSVSLYHDTDCNGTPDTPVSTPMGVAAGETVCLISRITASAGAGPGSSISYRLNATTAFADTTKSYTDFDTDRLLVGAGTGQLILVKTVRNETQGTPEGTSNSGALGDILEYRITLLNPSPANATDIIIYDRTPPYTRLAAPVPSPVAVSPALSCSVSVPASNSSGYSGPLRWDCAGHHGAGAEGSVTFRVQISP